MRLLTAAAAAVLCALLVACAPPPVDPLAAVRSARTYLEQDKPVEASIEAKRALQADASLGEARYLLTLALMRTGDVPGAELELRRAIQRGWPAVQTQPLLATLLVAQGKYKELIAELSSQALTEDAAQAQVRTLLAVALARTGKPAEAEKVLDDLLKTQPGHRSARIEKARLLAAGGKAPAATALVDELLKEDDKDADVLLLKASLMRAAGAPDAEVVGWYERAVTARPTLMEAHAALLSMAMARQGVAAARARWDEMNKHLPQHPQTLFSDAALALAEARPQRARELTQGLLKDAPDNARLLALAAQAETALGGRESATKMLQKAIQLEPQSVPLRVMQARLMLDSGNADAALAALRIALRESPDDVGLLLMQAQALLTQGDIAAADAAFDRAARLRPKDGTVRAERAMARLARGQEDWALNELRAAAQSDATSTTADLALFSARLLRGQYDAALAAATALAAKQPQSPLPGFLRGWLATERGDAAEARKAYEEALKKDPSHFASVGRLVALDLLEGQPAAARQRLQAVLQRDPDHLQAVLVMARVEAERPWAVQDVEGWLQKVAKAHPNEPSVAMASADIYLQIGQVDRARALVQTLAAQQEKSPQLLDVLGRIQLAAGDVVTATTTFSQLQSLLPRSPEPHLRLAQTYRQRQDWAMAAHQADKALALSPKLFAARRLRAELTLYEQGPKGGMASVKALQKDFPSEAAGWLLEGDAAAVDKQWAAAAAAYQQAMTKRRSADAHIRAYRVLHQAGQAAAAENLALQWLRQRPGDRPFILYRADVALRAGDKTTAASRYREVLALEPTDPVANNNLAMLLVAERKPEALPLAEMAVRQMPDRAEYIDTLAQALAAVKRLPEAIQWQAKAITLQPGNGDLTLTLARLHLQAGKPDLARMELKKLQALGDKFGSQKEVSDLLSRTGS